MAGLVLKWFLGILVAIFFLWIITGGPDRARNSGSNQTASGTPTSFFFRAVGPNDSYPSIPNSRDTSISSNTDDNSDNNEHVSAYITKEEIAKEIERLKAEVAKVQIEVQKAVDKSLASKYQGQFRLYQSQARNKDANTEYLTLTAHSNNTEPINITGWKLTSPITGRSATIGKASYLPYSGRTNSTEAIFVEPGESVIITSGRSPNGVSFRTNTCTGYFNQFQKYYPTLQNQCPRAYKDLPTKAFQHDDDCLDYIERIYTCVSPTQAPLTISDECRTYVLNDVNYNSCVSKHRGDLDFFGHEWRVYLGRDDALWKVKREVIKLMDLESKTVDVIDY